MVRMILSVIQRFVNRGKNLVYLFQVGCICISTTAGIGLVFGLIALCVINVTCPS